MNFKKDLPLTSSHWGTYMAKVKDGKVKELIGWENDKDPSPIGQGIVDVHNLSLIHISEPTRPY